MDDNSDDNYDYVSQLKYGSKGHNYPQSSSMRRPSTLSTTSTYDSDSDSDFCEIIDDNRLKKEENKNDNKDKEPSIETTAKEAKADPIYSESRPLSPPKSDASDHKSFAKVVKHLKNESNIESKPFFKTEVKPEVKPKVKPEVKPETKPDIKLKVENQKQESDSIEGNDEETNESYVSTGGEDSHSRDSMKSSDISSEVIKIIEKIRMISKGRPTFDRILIRFKKLKEVIHRSDASDYLMEVLNDCIQRGIIEENEKDDKELAFFPINANTFGNSFLKRSESPQKADNSHKKRRISETVWSDVDHNSKADIKTIDIDSWATDGYTDISDIDISSARDLFGDEELSPQMFEIFEVKPKIESPTSFSFNSTPIKSFNHKRNKEVIRKQLIAPSDESAEQLEERLSRNDYQNWLMEPLPRYTPFIAQKGDRVVYLRDAHNIYIEYELKELRELYPNFLSTPEEIDDAIGSDDYVINAVITEVKFCEINDITFSAIQLRSLSIAKPFKFNVVYRPNRGICEFLVLENLYKQSLTREWKKGEEFRSLWKKSWWIGVVNDMSIFDDKYPESMFKCLQITWNTGEEGRLSPWDLFPVDETRLPKRKENGVLVNREDMLSINYRPSYNEWPEVDGLSMEKWRCYECKRIYLSIKFTEKSVLPNIISIFKAFKNKSIAYPVNLQLIKERLKNMFYRRKDSVIRDITQLKTNARLEVKKKYFKVCEEFVDLLICIAIDCLSLEGNEYAFKHFNKYKHLMESSSDQSSDDNYAKTVTTVPQKVRPNVSTSSNLNVSNRSPIKQKSVSKKKPQRNRSNSQTTTSPEPKVTQSSQWKLDSHKFIEHLFNNEDSQPYRQAVDPIEFPFYRNVIDNPIDLSQIKTKLETNQYLNPIELRKDFRLMYENAKAFNRDPKSKIRVINKKLYILSEENLRIVVTDWERVYAYEQKQKNTSGIRPREPISRNKLWGYGAKQYY